MKNKITKLTGLLIILVFVVLACSGKKEEKIEDKGAGKIKDTIVYGISSSPTGIFNPLISDTVYDDAVNTMVYDSLLKLDKEQKLVPSMAESYEVSKDGLELTFKLKDNIKFSDGTPVTAKDVEFTLTSLADKDYPGEWGDYISKVVGVNEYKSGAEKSVKGIQVIDDKNIKITFTEIYAPALTNLGTVGIIPKHIWEKVPVANWKKEKDLLSKPVGSGPYKLAMFTEGQEVKFVKNENFERKPKTENIVFKVINEDTVIADLKNGQVDIVNVSNLKKDDREALKKENYQLFTHSNNLFQYMGLNYRNEIFKDLKVRQAFIYAIDRKGMVDNILEGNGVVTNVPLLTSSWAYPKDSAGIEKYEYNPEKAKQLLKEAGYTEKDGVLTNAAGKQLSFKLDVPTGNKIRELAAQIIQENLKQIGVKVELNKMEFPALMQKVVANHDFDLYMMGNNLPTDPDLTAYWTSSSVSNEKGKMGWNISGFATPELDSILKEGISTFDLAKRGEIYGKFSKYMNENIPWIYLFEQEIVIAANPNLKGFEPSVFRDFADAENWEISQ